MRRRILVLLAPLAIAVTTLTGCGYNQIQTLDEQAAKAKQQIDVQLQRRADLVPNLVNTVKGYAAHEEQVFREVAEARAGLIGAIKSGDPTQAANANAGLTGALGRLFAVAEAYPQLKADQSFLRLQDELTGTENRIAVSRSDYNDAVNQYNTYIRRLPQSLTAKVIGSQPRKYFEVTNAAANEAPTVDFSKPAAPTAPAAPATPAQ